LALGLGDGCFLRVPLHRGSSRAALLAAPPCVPADGADWSCAGRQPPDTADTDTTLGMVASISSMLKLASW